MEKLEPFLIWFVDRAKEPSTWAGGGVIWNILHATLGSKGDAITILGASICGVLAILLPASPSSPKK